MRFSTFVLAVAFSYAGLTEAADDVASAVAAGAPNAVADQRSAFASGGGVVLNGRYLARPYYVTAVPDGIEVNGQLVPEAWFNDTSRRRRSTPHDKPLADRVRLRLNDGAWLLGWDEGEYGIVGESQVGDLLSALSSERGAAEKIDELESLGVPWIARDDWEQLVDLCDVPVAVMTEFGVGDEGSPTMATASMAYVQAPEMNFRTSIYLLTVLGMGATVFALGTLLSYRPGEKMPWSHVNASKDATQLVLRSVLLLIGLAILDLVCTTISAKTVGFWELNPLGAVVLYSPFILGAFKIGATLLSGSILIALRQYHGAQVASWWLALFCTVLALRWVTFNSMFMA